MPEELTTAVELAFRHRVRHGVRKPHNWLQLTRFAAVGASGYIVNLLVFAVCVHLIAIDYKLAAVAAFVVSVLNNFWWNRHWTFGAADGHAGFQAARFFAVSVAALLINLVVLELLISDTSMGDLAAQAIAVAVAMPFNFLGNKLWTFA
jgi:dolichol-phosphate mannosyltransferase